MKRKEGRRGWPPDPSTARFQTAQHLDVDLAAIVLRFTFTTRLLDV